MLLKHHHFTSNFIKSHGSIQKCIPAISIYNIHIKHRPSKSHKRERLSENNIFKQGESIYKFSIYYKQQLLNRNFRKRYHFCKIY